MLAGPTKPTSSRSAVASLPSQGSAIVYGTPTSSCARTPFGRLASRLNCPGREQHGDRLMICAMEVEMACERAQGREPENITAEILSFDIRALKLDGVRYIGRAEAWQRYAQAV